MGPQRRGKLLLILGGVAGLPALALLALGIVGVLNTSNNVTMHEQIIDRFQAEADNLAKQPPTLQNRRRIAELEQRQQTIIPFLDQYKRERDLAFVILAGGLLCLAAAGILVLAHFLRHPNPS